MTSAATTTATLTVCLPLPPKELSKNGRVHWSVRQRLYREYREYGYFGMLGPILDRGVKLNRMLCYEMSIHWHYTLGRKPDDDNAVERCAAYRDAAQDVGLVNDDVQITTGRVTFERVKRGQEGVSLTFREAGP